jgi:uncharacterized YigZ family protein
MADPLPRYIPGGEARAEITAKKSRFIASAAPVFSVEEARDYIARVRSEFPDASHHVPIFLIGHGAGVTAHCSDAGEPSGTAGRPALAVLQGSGLGDVAVVVTRYFGGILLGTGGLVRAYSDAVRAVLAVLPKAEKVFTQQVMTVFPYTYLERVRMLVENLHGRIENEEFGENVCLLARFKEGMYEKYAQDLQNMTRGTVQAIIIDSNPNTIMPV